MSPIVYSSLISPNFIHLSPTTQTTSVTSLHPYFPSIQFNNGNKKRVRDIQLPKVASIPYQPINVEYLESEFSAHGVTFEDIGDSCVVKLGLDNGSTAILMLPSGLITSYRPQMWHGGVLELLHTTVSEGENGSTDAVIQGGVSLAFNCQSDLDDALVSWSPNNWSLREVRGNPQEAIQVEVVSRNTKEMVEVKHILTLRDDVLSTDLVVSNSSSTSLRLMGCVTSHLTVSTPEATYAIGLEGSDFRSRPPLWSDFSIIPPEPAQIKSWDPSTWGAGVQNNAKREEEMEEGEEDEDYKHLADQMSRIYTGAPRNFTIIDRGRRNSVVVGREGFDELYMYSPGSSHEWYGEYAYICVGQSALLQPIILNPDSEWRGSQHLHNPNL